MKNIAPTKGYRAPKVIAGMQAGVEETSVRGRLLKHLLRNVNASVCLTETQHEDFLKRVQTDTDAREDTHGFDSLVVTLNSFRLECGNCLRTRKECPDRALDKPVEEVRGRLAVREHLAAVPSDE